MDEYDLLLYEINREKHDELLKEINRGIKDREKIVKEEKKFWRGKKWNKKQRKLLEEQMKPPLQLNKINSCYELQRKQMREQMGLTDTEGLILTEENMKKLFYEFNNCCVTGNGGLLSKGVFYEDFSHFSSYLINKYFTKE